MLFLVCLSDELPDGTVDDLAVLALHLLSLAIRACRSDGTDAVGTQLSEARPILSTRLIAR